MKLNDWRDSCLSGEEYWWYQPKKTLNVLFNILQTVRHCSVWRHLKQFFRASNTAASRSRLMLKWIENSVFHTDTKWLLYHLFEMPKGFTDCLYLMPWKWEKEQGTVSSPKSTSTLTLLRTFSHGSIEKLHAAAVSLHSNVVFEVYLNQTYNC